MNILVIGGTGGFIGTLAVLKLAAAGHAVTVFHRGRTNADLPPDVRHLLGDRERLGDFSDEFRRLGPRVVLDTYLRFEREAVALMQTFRGLAERVVAVSSQDVYRTYGILWRNEVGPPNATPIAEDAPLRSALYPYRRMAEGPDDPKYDYDKIPVERAVMSDPELPGTVLRLPATYGPGDRQHRLFEYLKRMDDGRPFILLGSEEARWRQTHGYVENVADALALAATDARAAERVFNVGEEEARSRAEWVREIGRAVGWGGEVVAAPESLLPEHLRSPASYEHDLVADTSRIRKELGYEERVPRDEALLKTIAWERANPPAEVDPRQFDYRAEDDALKKIKENAR
ncbi:MAG TPA: NAD-dependent epimerase/dehydratase family protein [Pyrinomonadaceae bacterium]|nr:NAD-dependent epimerase/dehydratase family protein [Pyrinomonadaceae bacterium]